MRICRDDKDPFEFCQQFAHSRTVLWQFYCYMCDFIEFLNVNRPGILHSFMMDNLNIHKNPIMTNIIDDAGHCVVYWPPYWSCDGAIKYVLNTIHTMM